MWKIYEYICWYSGTCFLGAGYFGVAMKVAIDFRGNKEQLGFSGVAHIDLLPGVSWGV